MRTVIISAALLGFSLLLAPLGASGSDRSAVADEPGAAEQVVADEQPAPAQVAEPAGGAATEGDAATEGGSAVSSPADDVKTRSGDTEAGPEGEVKKPTDGAGGGAGAAGQKGLGEVEVPEAFLRKAQQWLGGGNDEAGRLLMMDIARDYPYSTPGKRAKEWLSVNSGLDRSGRVEFIVGSTLLGSYLGYTVSMGLATGDSDGDVGEAEAKGVIWSAVGGAAAGLVGSVFYSLNNSVSESQARLFSFLGSWGWFNGFFIYDLFNPLWDNVSDALLSGGLGMAIGVGTSFALWDRLNVDPGTAELATGMATYTTYFASLFNFVALGAGAYRDHEAFSVLMLLLPANAAFVGGFYLGDELKWSAGDIRLIELGGFLGTLLGGAMLVTIQPDIEDGDSIARVIAGTLAGFTAAGLVGAALVVEPWSSTGATSEKRSASGLNGLVRYDGDQWEMGAPLPSLLPRQVEGRTGVGFEVPLLSIRL